MEMQKMKYPISYPIGFDREDGSKQIAVRFPPQLFEQIIKMAQKEEKPFNTVVVDLVTCGKLCLDESDAMEPEDGLRG
jgi:hypothetical protein